jgi:integrase/recombinase XerD
MGTVTQLRQTDTVSDEEFFELWVLTMQVASCAPRTIKERRLLFANLGRFLGAPVSTATRTQLMHWLARPHLSSKTRQNYKSFLHTAFTLLQDEGLRIDNPAARLPRGKAPRIEANPFSTAEVQQLLDSGLYGRTRMMILLAAYQGFRAIEIASTSGDHIDWDRKLILTVDGKGGVEVWRPLHPAIVALAQAHPERFPRDGYWFPGIPDRSGKPHIRAKSVSCTVSAAITRAGIEGHRPHQLRAWFATSLMEGGASTVTIQNAMRHSSPNTLRHYIRPSMSQMGDAMAALPHLSVPTQSRTRGTRAPAVAGGTRGR